jgi:hypothetical protein
MITSGVGYTFTNSSKGFSLEIEQQSITVETPFKVFEDSTETGTSVIRVNAGTINNQLPTVGGAEIGTPNAYLAKPGSSGFVVLAIPASVSTGAPFPSGTPSVSFNSSVPNNNTSTAYVALAKLNVTTSGDNPPVLTISQLVSGSLWGERFECGSQLDYWFSQI